MLDACVAGGVDHVLLISSDLDETQANQTVSHAGMQFYCTAGVHPHQAERVSSDWLTALHQAAQHPNVVAIGECGLDFNRMFASEAAQINVFSQQLQLANQLELPVYLHERDAFPTQLALLNEQHIKHGIAHCFTGSTEQLRQYLDLGLAIGITGWLCDERRGQELQQAVQYIPWDRLILETDAPYLLPRNLPVKPKSRRNEPKYLPAIAEFIATLRGVSLEFVKQMTWQNSLQLFQRRPADGF